MASASQRKESFATILQRQAVEASMSSEFIVEMKPNRAYVAPYRPRYYSDDVWDAPEREPRFPGNCVHIEG